MADGARERRPPPRAAARPTSERTVVFLHGLVMDNLSSFYYTLAPAAARAADVVLYDLRGHGRTERPVRRLPLEDAVDDLRRRARRARRSTARCTSSATASAASSPSRRPAAPRRGSPASCSSRPTRAFEGWGAEMIERPRATSSPACDELPASSDCLAAGAPPLAAHAGRRRCEDLVDGTSLVDDLVPVAAHHRPRTSADRLPRPSASTARAPTSSTRAFVLEDARAPAPCSRSSTAAPTRC